MSDGTWPNRSRLIDAVIGTIMIVSTSTAVNIVLPEIGRLAKKGVQPNAEFNQGPNWSWTTGPSTRMPQSPGTTLGIAASISTSEPTTPRTPRGASSLREMPIATDTGAAKRTAKAGTQTVLTRKSRAPN